MSTLSPSPIISHSRESLVEKLTEALSTADVVVTSGGVSMGEKVGGIVMVTSLSSIVHHHHRIC